MGKIKVVLVEDDPFWQQNLVQDINREPDITVTYIASNKTEAIKAVETSEFDVILLDICLTKNEFDGLELAIEFHRMSVGPIIMLTCLNEKEIILSAFEYGAVNYITKSSFKDVVHAIREAYYGKVSIHSDVSNTLIAGYRKERKLRVLTTTEREVFDLREKGKSKAEIAKMLYKSVDTVKNQWKSIRSKLGGG
ncbi:response regulator [Paenibacillus tarimensis]